MSRTRPDSGAHGGGSADHLVEAGPLRGLDPNQAGTELARLGTAVEPARSVHRA